ncbi:MAG: PIN domain-containing protein [Maricaulaceae bacterium]
MTAPVVLDASALLVLALEEPGWERVKTHLSGAAVCVLNWAEALDVANRLGEAAAVSAYAATLDLQPAIAEDAERATSLLERGGRAAGLSLADGFCLALAKRLARPVLTADKAWARLKPGVPVRLIR